MGITPEEFKTGFVKRVSGWYRYTPEQLDDVYQAIRSISPEELQRGVTNLLDNSTYKPKIAEIRKALNAGRTNSFSSAASSNFIERLEAKEAASKAKVDHYTAQFMEFNDLASQAKAEGWELDLQRFVTFTADTMQQMIGKPKGYGWTSQAVPRHLVYVYRDLLKKAYPRIKSSEIIDVEVVLPDMAIPYWQAQGMREKPPATPTSKSFEAHCNAIVARLKGEWERKQA